MNVFSDIEDVGTIKSYQLADYVVKKTALNSNRAFSTDELYGEITGNYTDTEADYDRMVNLLKVDNAVDFINDYSIIANNNTLNINQIGGYIAYCNKRNLQQRLENANLKSQYMLNYWYNKTKFFPFIISITSLITSIIALIKQNN